ncbi:MAG: hypothetical protein ACXVDD_20725 [Polyangia bacterium]
MLAMCLSLALIILGVMGVTLGAAHWMIALDFLAGAIGLGLDAMLWATQGRASVVVAFVMSTVLVLLFFVGVLANAAPWLSWGMFGIAVAFFAIGCGRAFSKSMYGGEIEA